MGKLYFFARIKFDPGTKPGGCTGVQCTPKSKLCTPKSKKCTPIKIVAPSLPNKFYLAPYQIRGLVPLCPQIFCKKKHENQRK